MGRERRKGDRRKPEGMSGRQVENGSRLGFSKGMRERERERDGRVKNMVIKVDFWQRKRWKKEFGRKGDFALTICVYYCCYHL